MELKDIWRKIRTAIKDWLVGENPYEQKAADAVAETPEAAAEMPDDFYPVEPAEEEDEKTACALDWCYGGFNGSKAAEDAAVQIGGLKVSKSGMSYKWAKGNLRNWGINNDHDAEALACIFYEDGGEWRGGKFDWISTSRLTRDFKNIDTGYHGWDAAAFRAAKRYAFCIVSKDGKKRTNIIEG